MFCFGWVSLSLPRLHKDKRERERERERERGGRERELPIHPNTEKKREREAPRARERERELWSLSLLVFVLRGYPLSLPLGAASRFGGEIEPYGELMCPPPVTDEQVRCGRS